MIARLYSALASFSSICRSTVSLLLSSLHMVLSYAKRRCLSFLGAKGLASISLASQWYVIIIYWFPLRVWTGKRPVSSLYNLLMVVTFMYNLFERNRGSCWSGELVVGVLGLVDMTPCLFWTRFHMIVAVDKGSYPLDQKPPQQVHLINNSPGSAQISCTYKLQP